MAMYVPAMTDRQVTIVVRTLRQCTSAKYADISHEATGIQKNHHFSGRHILLGYNLGSASSDLEKYEEKRQSKSHRDSLASRDNR